MTIHNAHRLLRIAETLSDVRKRLAVLSNTVEADSLCLELQHLEDEILRIREEQMK